MVGSCLKSCDKQKKVMKHGKHGFQLSYIMSSAISCL